MTHVFYTALLLCALCAATAQPMSNTSSPNPLLCDPEKGLCELPSATPSPQNTPIAVTEKPVKIIYFTDPICSSCWGIEPQLRRLKLEYGHLIDIEYRMGGLLPSWEVYNSGGISKPADVAHHWDEVSAYYQMPIDGDVWLTDPLPSSYPPSIAFKAAQMQNPALALAFLRRIREMVFLEKKNITRWEYLQQAAWTVGLDTARLHQDVNGPALVLFQEDLMLAKSLGVRGFPTLLLSNSAQQRAFVYGFKPYDTFAQAVQQLVPGAEAKPFAADWQALFSHFATLTTQEFAVLSNFSFQAATSHLQALSEQGKLRRNDSKNGPIWQLTK